ncbi:nitrate/nitrite transporter NarK [Nitrospirillum amazonense]|uniref:Nitrate/nitrite transporter NarK n=2 Tax=Nitrospirillum amazonense TaxID=28077 RepID=A0A560JCC8_9PROT|nr:OFA family MFS transporter [Nitrospirillum amazonense]MDG3440032.1 OFA family MFS transporter [Nitrospirillum amazonense]TWB68848.1 nitrate/nitrite transporter NarK [Nitrospirillum amazonense]
MSVATSGRTGGSSSGSILDRERIVAKAGFNRWLVPPAALAIHLCIGMAYGFSVFWLPLSKTLAGTDEAACKSISLIAELTTTTCNWQVSDLTLMYTLFFVVLGSAAAVWGGWLERVGPRRAGVVAAFCWCGGMVVSAVGIMVHQLWLLWLGGIVGGVGLGLGYISPVSTLIKWFPDRRGMATGMAIMGFGGGAMIGSPLANILINQFKSSDSAGVWQTFLAMAAIYFVFMMAGAFGYRVPPAGWRPDGWTPPAAAQRAMITHGHVHLDNAHKTPQFWLIWAVLCLNVSAGIGVIGMASPMLQEIFAGKLIGHPELGFDQLDPGQKTAIATIGAAFTGLISLFNIGGRFFWASMSDKLGRKMTYCVFFVLGLVLYAAAPSLARAGSVALFVLAIGVILSMYGGGFATVPAYLADIFGTQFVGAIHGRLLTAWSVAGVAGPFVVTRIRDAELALKVPKDHVYDVTFYVLAVFLIIGLLCNLAIKQLAAKWFMSDAQVAALQAKTANANATGGSFGIGRGGLNGPALLAWLAVGLPILWGVWTTLQKAAPLFN